MHCRQLETVLAAANDEIGELKMRSQGADGRITALEGQLARTEGNKREVEFKLSQLHSTLRRTIGLRVGGRSCSPAPRSQNATKGSKCRLEFDKKQ